MTTKGILERYNNLSVEEEFVNNYLYNPINLKYSEIVDFKRPKKFYVNKSIENFRTNKKGNLKTLREFQNLYIHKFIINPNKKGKNIYFSFGIKKKNKNKNLNNNIYYKEIEKQRPISEIEFLKRTNNLLSPNLKRNSSSLIKVKNRNNQLLLKLNKDRIPSSIKSKNNNNSLTGYIRSASLFLSRQQSSRLTLIKELSNRLLGEKNKKEESFKFVNYPLKKNNSTYLIESGKSRNSKFNTKLFETYDISKVNTRINNNKIQNSKFIEFSRNNCNLSHACVIRKQICSNSIRRTKLQKRPKIPLRLFSSDLRKMSTLEKYYLKFGVFPYY